MLSNAPHWILVIVLAVLFCICCGLGRPGASPGEEERLSVRVVLENWLRAAARRLGWVGWGRGQLQLRAAYPPRW